MSFGVISGPCHIAVDVKLLRQQGIARLFDPKSTQTKNWYRLPATSDGPFPKNLDDQVAIELQAGALYGPAFRIPFATYELTLRRRSGEEMGELVRALQSPYRMQNKRGD